MRRRKGETDISIIGGADGPTSVFLAGKWSDAKDKKISYRQKRNLNKKIRQLNKLKKSLIKEGIVSHTLEELEEYICTKNKAIAISQDSEQYQRALKALKSNLIFKYYEDMIPMEHPTFPEKNLTPEGLREYNEKIQEWFKAAEEVKIPDEEICFHYYKIEVLDGKDRGEIFIELELIHEILNVSSRYSSNKKSLFKKIDKLQKDIYFYYGETEENMDKASERFLTLAAALQSSNEIRKKKRRTRWICYMGSFFLVFGLLKGITKRISMCKKACYER